MAGSDQADPGTGAVVAARSMSQLLAGPAARSAFDVVTRLLAVQAQDPRGARLAIRARTTGLLAADVDRALSTERSLVMGSLNRGTLHLVRSEDYWWLHSLTTPSLSVGNARRLAEEGVTPAAADRGADVIERALAADGPQTRGQLRDRLDSAGVRTQGQALVHILMLAGLRGIAVRGPMAGREHAYVLARDWIGAAPPRADRDRALAELARRYLAGHGPATDRDLAKWAGLRLGDARNALAAIGSALSLRADGMVQLSGSGPAPELPSPRLLGAFDPLLMGWTSRRPVLAGHEPTVVAGGVFRPFALVGGRAAATWKVAGSAVVLTPFTPLSPGTAATLDADADDVVRFLGLGGAHR